MEAGAEYDATELMLANGPFDLDILIDQVTMCACRVRGAEADTDTVTLALTGARH